MTANQPKTYYVDKLLLEDDTDADLIVFNDDYNEFTFVVDCFSNVCELSRPEAWAITEYIHHNGQGVVKSGPYSELKPMRDKLVDCGLNAIVARRAVN